VCDMSSTCIPVLFHLVAVSLSGTLSEKA
jgi:hypothetical protein